MDRYQNECKIIAEMGAEHQRSFQKALAIVWAAAEAGADALKIQMFTPDDMTLNSRDEKFIVKEEQWSGQSLYELYEKACMPYDWIPRIKEHVEARGMEFIVTVFHPRTVPIAEEMGIKFYKVASFEINYKKLFLSLDKTDKPVIVSTGSATYKEIENVVKILRRNLTLLKCTSQYPAPIESMNLSMIPALEHCFNVPAGLSDHTKGIVAPVVAVVLGAKVIEKHISVDCKGLDGNFAILPDRFAAMVQAVRAAEKSIGKIDWGGKRSYHRQEVDGEMVRVVA
jgi:pseudaminic acid synthase